MDQTNYIILKISQKCLIKDSRSYGAITTVTYHKLVRIKINLEWSKLSRKKPSPKVINRGSFNDPILRQEYQENFLEKVQTLEKKQIILINYAIMGQKF